MNNHDKIKSIFGGLKVPEDFAERVLRAAEEKPHKFLHRQYRIERVVLAVALVALAAVALLAVPRLRRMGKAA
jgi:hypothetical protein